MPNLKDVAHHAKVSPMTVSRVVNQSGYVREETRQKVLRAIEELNYIPNGMARSLVQQKTFTVTLMVPDITNPFYTTIARGVEDVALKNGYRLILCNHDEDKNKEREYVRMCILLRTDGVVLAATGDESQESLELFSSQGVPYVLVGRQVRGINADLVKSDNVVGARQLVEYLIALGHTRIAVLGPVRGNSSCQERLLGYRQAMGDHGFSIESQLVIETMKARRVGSKEVSQLLACVPRPTAIFALGNDLAFDIIRSLKEMNVRVPEDISVVCFDDIDSMYQEPLITAANQQAYSFGSISMQLLLERMQSDTKTSPRRVVLQPDLIVRSTTAPPNSR